MIRGGICAVKSHGISANRCISLRKFLLGQHSAYSNLPPLLQTPFSKRDKPALIDENGSHSYADLTSSATRLSNHLITSRGNLKGERIAFLTPNNASYVIAKWATWLSGGISVPLCKSHPPADLSYVINDSKPRIVITTPEYSEMMGELVQPIGADLITIPPDFAHEGSLDKVTSHHKSDHAMIVYTSGTTGPPKGVLWSHSSLQSQVSWQYAKHGRTVPNKHQHYLKLCTENHWCYSIAAPKWKPKFTCNCQSSGFDEHERHCTWQFCLLMNQFYWLQTGWYDGESLGLDGVGQNSSCPTVASCAWNHKCINMSVVNWSNSSNERAIPCRSGDTSYIFWFKFSYT